MPIAISVNMLRLRVSSDFQPRSKNGAPAHNTTGVAKTKEIQFDHAGGTRCIRPKWPPISITNTGSVSTSAIQNRLRHVLEFRIRRIVERDLFGLQRHAADRARTGADLPHLGMHRTGIDGAGGRCSASGSPPGCQEFLRLRLKALAAPRAAKEIILAFVDEAMLCGRGIDLHAADRIDRELRPSPPCWPPQQASAAAP